MARGEAGSQGKTMTVGKETIEMNFSKRSADTKVAVQTLSEPLKNNNDMSRIYFELGKNPMFKSKKCPALFCGMEIPEECAYLTILYDNNPVLIYTSRGLSDEDILKIVVGETKEFKGVVAPCPVGLEHFCVAPYLTKSNNATFYYLGAKLAKAMQIRCPQIIVMNELSESAKGYRGTIVFEMTGVFDQTAGIGIYEKSNCGEIDMFEALAHEMRHYWQYEKHREKYLKNYKYAWEFEESCREQYHLQLAEIDASAYALRFIQACTGEDLPANSIFPNVNREVERYAKTLDDSLFRQFVGMMHYSQN